MPCQYYTPHEEAAMAQEAAQRMRADLDRLTHENDELRELVLRLTEDRDYVVPQQKLKKIGVEQVNHRKEDLARLKKVFTKSRDAERLGLVMLADPKNPLEPQLGFDPNDF